MHSFSARPHPAASAGTKKHCTLSRDVFSSSPPSSAHVRFTTLGSAGIFASGRDALRGGVLVSVDGDGRLSSSSGCGRCISALYFAISDALTVPCRHARISLCEMSVGTWKAPTSSPRGPSGKSTLASSDGVLSGAVRLDSASSRPRPSSVIICSVALCSTWTGWLVLGSMMVVSAAVNSSTGAELSTQLTLPDKCNAHSLPPTSGSTIRGPDRGSLCPSKR
mmetsp:Transcript_28933/g.68579  ORF Transcript_28933/g.68579 Transcript_28933/m.68579 type:complete len:222 (-) Transcript_28933:1693-2358(-)